MAKTQAKTRVSPIQFGFTQPIVADGAPRGALQVIQAQNWVHGKRRQSWFGLTTAADGWDTSGNAVGTLRGIVQGSLQTLLDTDRYVDTHQRLHDLTFYAECNVIGGGETVQVICTITGSLGSVSRTLNFTSANNGNELSGSITGLSGAVADNEWAHVTVTMQRTVGAGTTHQVIELELEEQEQTSSLPDPDDD